MGSINLLTIKIFNWTFDWTMEEALFWLLVAQVVLILFLVLVFAILMRRVGKVRAKDRRIIRLSIDTSMVKRSFNKEDSFDCSGLLISTQYNIYPISEYINEYNVITKEEYEKLDKKDRNNTCFVIVPDMNEVGKNIVEIVYKDVSTRYVIEVLDQVKQEEVVEEVQEEKVVEQVMEEEPVEEVVEEESVPIQEERIDEEAEEDSNDGGTLRYDRSFMARYIQSEEDIKEWYISLKNEILSYKKVKARISWKKETFRLGRNVLARFSFRGKTLCLYLALNPADYADSKYKVEDVKDQISYVDTPCMYRLKNERRVKYAMELIKEIMDKNNVIREERPFEEYYLPYEGTVELINKGLIKRVIKRNEEEAIFNKDSNVEISVNEETTSTNNNMYQEETSSNLIYENDNEEVNSDILTSGDNIIKNIQEENSDNVDITLDYEEENQEVNEDVSSEKNDNTDGE